MPTTPAITASELRFIPAVCKTITVLSVIRKYLIKMVIASCKPRLIFSLDNTDRLIISLTIFEPKKAKTISNKKPQIVAIENLVPPTSKI